MHGDELGPVWKGRLDLHVIHQLGDRTTVARTLDHEIGDERNGLRIVELDAALQPSPRHHGSHGDEQLVLFARRQVHAFSFSSSSSSSDSSSEVSTSSSSSSSA